MLDSQLEAALPQGLKLWRYFAQAMYGQKLVAFN
jgi:hypothetical protein